MTIITSGNSMNWEGADFCDCEWPSYRIQGEFVKCKDCNGLLECEICEDKQPATVIHIDYVVCKKHEWDAISNVASRRW